MFFHMITQWLLHKIKDQEKNIGPLEAYWKCVRYLYILKAGLKIH